MPCDLDYSPLLNLGWHASWTTTDSMADGRVHSPDDLPIHREKREEEFSHELWLTAPRNPFLGNFLPIQSKFKAIVTFAILPPNLNRKVVPFLHKTLPFLWLLVVSFPVEHLYSSDGHRFDYFDNLAVHASSIYDRLRSRIRSDRS